MAKQRSVDSEALSCRTCETLSSPSFACTACFLLEERKIDGQRRLDFTHACERGIAETPLVAQAGEEANPALLQAAYRTGSASAREGDLLEWSMRSGHKLEFNDSLAATIALSGNPEPLALASEHCPLAAPRVYACAAKAGVLELLRFLDYMQCPRDRQAMIWAASAGKEEVVVHLIRTSWGAGISSEGQ